MEDSIRFADQSKALWMQQNGNVTSISSNEYLNQKKRNSSGCVGRCPFASIIATVITICGTGIFSGCLYKALSITIQMLSSAFRIEWEMEWVRIVQTVVIIISTVMGSLSLILLLVGCLATGATRAQIFTGFRSRLGGRISTGFFTIIVYALFLIWSTVTILLVVPIIAYLILMNQCEFKQTQITTHSQNKLDECLTLRNYGIQLSNAKNSICSHELIEFCNQVRKSRPINDRFNIFNLIFFSKKGQRSRSAIYSSVRSKCSHRTRSSALSMLSSSQLRSH